MSLSAPGYVTLNSVFGVSWSASTGAASCALRRTDTDNVPASSYSASIAVSWSTSANANNYVLEEREGGGNWGVAYSGADNSTTVTVPETGTCQFQVAACEPGGCSAFTASTNVLVTLTPTVPQLSGPSSISTSGSFTLTWTTAYGATSYQLHQQQSGTDKLVYDSTGGSWTSSMLGNGAYSYQVFACNAAGCSAVSNTVTVMHLPTSAPNLSGPSSSSTGTFTLGWTAVSGATSYRLHQILSGTDTQVYSGSARTWSLNALMGGSYAYHVNACNVAGCGPSSNTVTVSVAAHAPAVPSPIHVPGIVTVNVPFGVSWSAQSGATRYELTQTNVSFGTGPTTVYSGAGTSTVVTLSGRVNQVFDYSARACNSVGCSGWVTRETDLTGSGTPMALPAAAGSSGP